MNFPFISRFFRGTHHHQPHIPLQSMNAKRPHYKLWQQSARWNKNEIIPIPPEIVINLIETRYMAKNLYTSKISILEQSSMVDEINPEDDLCGEILEDFHEDLSDKKGVIDTIKNLWLIKRSKEDFLTLSVDQSFSDSSITSETTNNSYIDPLWVK